MLNVLSFVISGISILLKYLLFDCYLQKKEFMRNKMPILIIIIFIILDYVLKFIGKGSPFINVIVSSLLTASICFLLFNGRNTTKILLLVIFIFFIAILDLLIGVSINLIFHKYILTDFSGLFQVISAFMFYSIEFFIINYIMKKRVKKKPSGERRLYLLQAVIPVLSIFYVLFFIYKGLNKGTIHPSECYIMIAVFVAINTIQYIVYEIHEKLFTENYNNIILNERYKMKEIYYSGLEERQDEIRAIRHDLKNQLITIYYYLKADDIIKAKDEIRIILNDIDESYSNAFSNNISLNVLLNAKYNAILEKNICFEYDIKVPDKLEIVDRDLMRILGNAIDNAIEASEMTPEKERFIKLKMYYSNNCLVIQIINNTDGRVRDIETRKIDKDQHGLGLKSINSLVKKYNGSMEYYIYEHEFKIGITLWV